VYCIQNFTKVLDQVGAAGPYCSSENDPTVQFPCPLIWLIHVIGDVHQPLHCGYGYDKGGNDVKVTFFGKQTELHAVWDSGMIYHYLDPSNGDWYDLYQYLASDLKSNPSRIAQYANVTDPVGWANESITLVINDVYNFDPTALTAAGEPALGVPYYNHNFPIAVQRMQAAGIRLATTLNKAFEGSSKLEHFDQALASQIEQIKAAKK
jgi:hypothetical protein